MIFVILRTIPSRPKSNYVLFVLSTFYLMHSRHEGKKRQVDDSGDVDAVKRIKRVAEFDLPTKAVQESQAFQGSLPRPARTGAGSGGRTAQLQRIGAVLEAPQKRKSRTTLPEDAQRNPLAPESLSERRVSIPQIRAILSTLITVIEIKAGPTCCECPGGQEG